MYKNKRILAYIPARGGSKGIKDKNIREIGGRPLIDFSIKVANNSKYIDYTLVSTDSEKISEIAKKCGASVPFLREILLAKDESKTIDAMLSDLKKLSLLGQDFDYVVLLQPTQPLRTSNMIDDAISTIIDKNLISLISVSEVEEHPILMRTINSLGKLEKILPHNSTVRRQDFQKIYKVNGNIYINKIDDELNENTSLNDNIYPFFQENKWDLDIDTLDDLENFKAIYTNNLIELE